MLTTLLCVGAAAAHPVAQGQLEVQWRDGELQLAARVSSEQILVASSQGPSTADSLDELRREHGDYLLAHLRVHADDQLLHGKLMSLAPAEGEFVVYRLIYPLARIPQRLQFQQDLLNEIAYAPGNPWEASFLVRSRLAADAPRESLLASRNRPLLLEAAVAHPTLQFVGQFVWQGVRHILSGYDHLLFVTALVLAAFTLRSLITVIASFTLAHSITLALSAFGVVRLPGAIIEPMIAASIVAVALANMLWPGRSDNWARLAAAFFFGLFHGLGFAGGLLEATEQLTTRTLALAIGSFSAGVECAHLMVVVPLFFLLKTLNALLAVDIPVDQTARVTLRVGSAFVSLAGAFYLARALP